MKTIIPLWSEDRELQAENLILHAFDRQCFISKLAPLVRGEILRMWHCRRLGVVAAEDESL